MNVEQFKENLLIHGADVHGWPEDVRPLGLLALSRLPEAQALVAAEERFERIFKERKVEDPGPDFAARIVAAALPEKKKARCTFGVLFSELLGEFSLLKPARTALCFTIIFALILGFSVGFIDSRQDLSTETIQLDLREPFYDEGDVL